jgi:hypothetical protein
LTAPSVVEIVGWKCRGTGFRIGSRPPWFAYTRRTAAGPTAQASTERTDDVFATELVLRP